MKEQDKTKEQLIDELADLRQRIAELEASETERKRAEEPMQRQREELQTIIDSVSAYIFYKDREGRHIYVNRALAEATGIAKEKWIGKTIAELLPKLAERYQRDDEKVMSSGRPKMNIIEPFETPEGIRWAQTDKIPIKDEEGNVIGLTASSIDITERKRAEEALRESEGRLREIVENMPVLFDAFDENGMALFWNKECERVTGYSSDEIVGNPKSLELVCPDPEYCARVLEQLRELGSSYRDWELDVQCKNGETRTIAWSNISRDHPIPGWWSWGIGVDVTERVRAEEALREYSERLGEMVEERTQELREAQEELVGKERLAVLGQLASGVGHELRNPLGAISNVAYFLNMALEDPEPEVKEALEIMDKEVGTCDRIIGSLLDLARTKPPTRREVDLNDVVRVTLSRVAVSENVEVVSRLDESLPTILADPVQLDRVFGNIILNASQAMPEGGRLVVETSEVSGKPPGSEEVVVSFADTGVGIPEENLAQIFGPLFTTKAKGIGLGLALSKMLVEAHGGTIEVESPSAPSTTLRTGSLRAGEVGKGSTFVVRLPTGTE